MCALLKTLRTIVTMTTTVTQTDVSALDSLTLRLRELSQLPQGWLDGEGDEITQTALQTAKNIATAVIHDGTIGTPTLFPTEEGGIELEWRDNGLLKFVEIDPDGVLFAGVAYAEGGEDACPVKDIPGIVAFFVQASIN